jgi:hypothetical protein
MGEEAQHPTPETREMKSTVIIDIDGTLTKVGARVECLKSTPPDWDSFYARCGEDFGVPEITVLAQVLDASYRIILCSGRRESCRADTERWMDRYGVRFDMMLLRKDGDHRHETEVKPEMLAEAGIQLEDIAFVLEDRNSMVKKWRELGLICLQVAEGDF